MPNVSKNPLHLFQSHQNLLTLYTNTNIEKAMQYGQMIGKEEFSQMHQKEYNFMMANIHLL